jgi:hypothetical protein
MIDPSLENFFEVSLTNERYKLYIDIISYLESIEYETIQSELLNLAFMTMGDEDDSVAKPESTICDEMHAHLFQCIISQLRISGIGITEDATLKDAYDLIVGVSHIASFDDTASIIACTCTDDGPFEQMTEILHLVTTLPAVHWAMVLDTVSPQLVARIQELGNLTVNSQYEAMEETAEYLQKLRLYKEYADKLERQLVFFDLVESSILGREFETYLNSGILSEYFEGNQMDLLALELYGVALMSCDAKNDPAAAIRTLVEKYMSDTARIVKLNNEVTMVNGGFVKFFQSTSKGLTI